MKPYYMFTVCLLVLVMLVFAVGCSNNEKSMVNAVKNGDIAKVQSLLDKGVDPNLKTDDGKTILMLSVYLGHFDISALLIGKGADVNAQDNDGKTALMIAAENGDIEMAKLLLENGADIGATDKNGKTALQLAQEKGQNDMADFLIKWKQPKASIPATTPGPTESPAPTAAETVESPASSTQASPNTEPSSGPNSQDGNSDVTVSEESSQEVNDNGQLSSIYFNFDKAVLRPDQMETMAEILEIVNDSPDMLVIIGGHADERGAKKYNQALSVRRAKAVQTYLMNNGIDPKRIILYGFGEEHPLEKDHNEEAWKENRRADILLWDVKLTRDEVLDETVNP